MQGTRKYLCFENQCKMFFSSHLTRTAWNTNTCSIHHWTRSSSTEEEFTGNRSRTRKIALLWEERKEEPCGIKCPSPPYRQSAQSRTKEETCGEQTAVHELAGWLSSKVKWYWRGISIVKTFRKVYGTWWEEHLSKIQTTNCTFHNKKHNHYTPLQLFLLKLV